MGTRLLLLLAAWLAPWTVYAQPEALQFKRLTSDQGLSRSNVVALVQDHKGFIWAGTPDGLNRYDGYRFTVYKRDRSNPNSLASNEVNALLEDKDQNLWIGHSRGVSRYDHTRNSFVNHLIGKGGPASSVTRLVEDQKGRLWVGTNDGLYLFDREKETFTRVNGVVGRADAQGTEFVSALIADPSGHLWIGGFGIVRYHPDTKDLLQLPYVSDDPGSLLHYQIYDFAIDQDGLLWVATNGAGLASLPLATPDPAAFTRYEHDPRDPGSLTNPAVKSLFVDRQNNVWAGTENGGLDLLDRATGTFHHNRGDASNPKSLSNNSIWAMLEDRVGDLWVGTFAGGINVASRNAAAIQHVVSIPGDPSSLKSNVMTAFLEDSRGDLWAATDGGGFHKVDRATGRVVRYNKDNSSLRSDAVLTLYEDSKGNFWVGAWAGGLTLFNRDRKTFRSFTPTNSGLPNDHIFNIFEDSGQRLWLATFGGLVRFDRASRRFTAYSVENSGIVSNRTVYVRETREGLLVVGTSDGLSIFDPNTETFENYVHDEEDENSLSHNTINGVLVDAENNVWLATEGGLEHFDVQKKRFTHYQEADGLPSSAVKGVVIDAEGFMWVSTSNGVCRFDVEQKSCRIYTKADGLQGNEFNRLSAYVTSRNEILLGGFNGFNIIRPDLLKKNENPPPVVVTNFLLFNRPVEIGAEGSPLERHISETEQLVLTHEQSVFSFEFTALDFAAPEKNQYAYQMEGFDTDWNYVGAQRTASYTNLDPGEYVFRVKASNNDGVWNEEGVAIRVVITPPFWATWWFRLFVVLAVGAGIYAFLRNAKARRLNLEAMNAQLNAEIEHSRLAEAEKERLAAEAAERDRIAKEEIERYQSYLENSVMQLLHEMERFSEGDLTVSLEVRSDDVVGRLYQGFNRAVSNIRTIVFQVIEAVSATATMSSEIYTSTEELSLGAQEQTRQALEVASAVQEMTYTIAENTRHITMAAQLAQRSGQDAHQGGAIVRETIGGMNKIAEVVGRSASSVQALGANSQQIGDIAQVIDEIAEQTNLLALNAAIEAARAGDQGRGFAVVADEVRKLAERTTVATKEIADMIRRIQSDTTNAVQTMSQVTREVDTGKEMVNRAGVALDSIIDNSEKVLDSITQVATASEEQSTTSEHISQSIEAITNVTRSSALGNEAIARSTQDLIRLMENLQSMVARFRLDSSEVMATTGRHAAAPRVAVAARA